MTDDKSKLAECSRCGAKINVGLRANCKNVKCADCIREYKKQYYHGTRLLSQCKYCGDSVCQHPDICRRGKSVANLHKYFGFDITTLGSSRYYQEFNRIKTIVETEYIDDELSGMQLCQKYNHSHVGNFYKLLHTLGISIRSKMDAQSLSMIHGRDNICPSNYKHGWHTTWFGKSVFYRSSYELTYMMELDNSRTYYEYECLRIQYWDSIKKMYRISVPDFYLPSINTIVETKCEWLFNKVNILDRLLEYRKHGYNFRLILEGRVYESDEIIYI